MITEWLAALIPPIGWGITVERRLAKLDAIKEKVDDTGDKVDRLVDHLISESPSRSSKQDR